MTRKGKKKSILRRIMKWMIALVLKTSASTVWISTDAAAQGDKYKSLKAQGVGERRMVYRYSITQSGECVFTLLADGKTLEAEGIYTVTGKEDGV